MLRFLPLLVLLGACGPDYVFGRQDYMDTFFQEPPAKVDILWVVDNSPSMQQEQEEVANRFENFIYSFEQTNIEFHIGVITTDMDIDNPDRATLLGDPPVLTPAVENYRDLFVERVQVGLSGSDMERGLEAAYQAVTEPMISDRNAGFLRSNAVLSIIIVSDENDCSDRGALPADATNIDCYEHSEMLVPVAEYVSTFRAMRSDPSQVVGSAIVGPRRDEGCQASVPGTRYMNFAESLGGVEGNICEENFSGIMEDLGLTVSGVRASFQLTYTPVEHTIEVFVAESEKDTAEAQWTPVAESPEAGWTFDFDTRYLTFHGDSVPERGAVIHVRYDIAG
ncbi:MAG: VWA domain-containing protein [Deltaproteobacteria bacterium]|nr:VWA domain-containing protein [Deltaproteobacteria bacterium]